MLNFRSRMEINLSLYNLNLHIPYAWCFTPNIVAFLLLALEKKIYSNSPSPKEDPVHLCRSPLQKDHPCQAWFNLV